MNLIITHGDTAETARWTAIYNTHPLGMLGFWDHQSRFCCRDGHPTPTDAVDHAAALETARIMEIVSRGFSPGSIGHTVLAGAA